MTPEERARECWRKYSSGRADHKRQDLVNIIAVAIRDAREEEREACAKIAEKFVGGFTANIRTNEFEKELIPDKDGPWVLNRNVAAAIRARGKE